MSEEYDRFLARVLVAHDNGASDEEIVGILADAKRYPMLPENVRRRLDILRARLMSSKEGR
jgi:hypothetical protein